MKVRKCLSVQVRINKMCGIFCIFCNVNDLKCDLSCTFKTFCNNIQRRGPDAGSTKNINVDKFTMLFAANVLWLQGNEICVQPIENDNSVLLYNGDIFESSKISADEKSVCGDTSCFLRALEDMNEHDMMSRLSAMEGPYAFVYFDKKQYKLFFGRDKFGRRSLLVGKSKINGSIILTSVAKRKTDYEFMELPANGIFCFNLSINTYQIYPWHFKNLNFSQKLQELKTFLNVDISVISNIESNGINFINPNEQEIQEIKELKNIKNDEVFSKLSNATKWKQSVMQLQNLLEAAIEKRIDTQPNFCKNCILHRFPCNHSSVGVLFSGGVDCAILALLSNKFVPQNQPIDLINVAFDRVLDFKTPDRITGLQTLKELQDLCPNRKWNFVEVNVKQEELNDKRKSHIADLIYPLNSVLDDSLGCALWFASCGQSAGYISPCRVLLVGMGADELFGGYTKHRAAFKRNSWFGLMEILEEDWQNLPYRNLARDDRVVSDHGRQLRTPYLDENVVNFVRNLKPWEKTYPSDDLQGLGEKLLLRSLAYHLGLKNAATLKKRALQFGSRIANSKENAHDVSQRLL